MVTRRLAAGVGAAATVLALLTGCAGQGSLPVGPGPERSAPAPPSSRSSDIDLSAVERYAREHFPDVFAGIAVEAGGVVAVYRVPPAPEFDRAIGQELGPTPFVLRDAARSERELQSITRQVLDDSGYWRSQGIEIHGAGPDFVNGVVQVMTPRPDAAAGPLRARYGDVIVVREGIMAFVGPGG